MKKNLVVLSGAGISAESGLQTFRDADGLWMGYDIYEVASPRGWRKDPALVLDFYNKRRRDIINVKPNAAHTGLAELEKYFNVTIITQNIDDLHERGGSSNILHLHGEIFKMRSELSEEEILDIQENIELGQLASDGGQFRPHIVWFEEPVPMIPKAVDVVRNADIFVVIGTSLQVYPAAGLLDYVSPLVPVYVIDKRIPYTRRANNIHVIEKPASEGVEDLKQLLLQS